MDPITLATGALIALVSLGIGHLNGRRTRKRVGPAPAECDGCHHGLSYHNDGGKCHGTHRRIKYSSGGSNLGWHDVPCTCQQYVGPVPADRMLASFLGPAAQTMPPTPPVNPGGSENPS
jgi:hypothetical protein